MVKRPSVAVVKYSAAMDGRARELLLEIARCPVITRVIADDPSKCHDVVRFQKRPLELRWVAEPWCGHLDRAPILFVSSNPSAGDPDAPLDPDDLTWSSDDDLIADSYDQAFDPGPWFGIHDGTHLRSADGTVGKYVSYWGSCKSRASEILGRPAVPGEDYALTEVVHCGSQHEIGVWAAATVCVPRYLDRVLKLSPAPIVVVVGAVARGVVQSMVSGTTDSGPLAGPIAWAGRDRHVLFLPHPNARGVPKGVAAALGDGAWARLLTLRSRSWL